MNIKMLNSRREMEDEMEIKIYQVIMKNLEGDNNLEESREKIDETKMILMKQRSSTTQCRLNIRFNTTTR